MTKETKQQIYNDSVKYMAESTYISADDCSFRSGAMHQDPIAEKRGYNQGFQDALKKAARAITENHQKCITVSECEILNLKPDDE